MVVGTVKSYNSNKGWGFINGPNGKEVFMHHADLGGRMVKEGDTLNFTVTQGDKGPVAKNIKVTVGEEKYKGSVKSWVWTKGYGFITCDAFPGQDIFFSAKDISEQAQSVLKEGSHCTFKTEASDKGNGVKATNMYLVGAAGDAAKNAGYGGGKGGGGGGGLELILGLLGGKGRGQGVWQPHFQKGSWGKGDSQSNKFKIDKSGGELGEFTGKIKSFGYRTNYGFIECAELAGHGDVFLHGDMKKGYEPGQVVKFTCILTKEGKPTAINLKSGLK